MPPNPDALPSVMSAREGNSGHHLESILRKLELERDAALRDASDARDQVEALAAATKSLTRVVDSAVLGSGSGGGGSSGTADGVSREERRLDDLLRRDAAGLLEGIGFAALANGCKRLSEKLRLTVLEADDALAGERTANEASDAAKEKFKITSRALTKLYKENAELKKENAKLKKNKKRVAREVSDYVEELKSEGERKVSEAYALMAHERAMLPPAAANHHGKLDSFLGMSDDDESSSTVGGGGAFLPFPSPSSTCVSASCASTSSSLVTDGGSATLRFRACTDDDISVQSVQSTLSAKVLQGLQQPVTAEGSAATVNSAQSSPDRRVVASNDDGEDEGPVSAGNIMGMLMSREGVDRRTYHINFSSSRIGLRMRSIPSRRPRRGAPSSAGKSAEVFLVCGFRDYDLSLDKRPELGARLVAVDNASVEDGDWDLKKVCDKIRSREGVVCLSFRNVKLSKEDIVNLDSILAPPGSRMADTEMTEGERRGKTKLPFRKIWVPAESKRRQEASLDSQYYI